MIRMLISISIFLIANVSVADDLPVPGVDFNTRDGFSREGCNRCITFYRHNANLNCNYSTLGKRGGKTLERILAKAKKIEEKKKNDGQLGNCIGVQLSTGAVCSSLCGGFRLFKFESDEGYSDLDPIIGSEVKPYVESLDDFGKILQSTGEAFKRYEGEHDRVLQRRRENINEHRPRLLLENQRRKQIQKGLQQYYAIEAAKRQLGQLVGQVPQFPGPRVGTGAGTGSGGGAGSGGDDTPGGVPTIVYIP